LTSSSTSATESSTTSSSPESSTSSSTTESSTTSSTTEATQAQSQALIVSITSSTGTNSTLTIYNSNTNIINIFHDFNHMPMNSTRTDADSARAEEYED
jgi:hypothetical protein